MKKPKCLDLDYINFLIAAQKTFTCTEASRSSPDTINKPAHDAFTRLLQRQPLSSENLWNEVKTFVKNDQGVLIIDDTVLEKPYSQKNGLITYLWSNKEKKVVKGVGLITLLWTDGKSYIPCDFRVYDKPIGGQTKNQHFKDMLKIAKQRGLNPSYILMDSWYASLENLKFIANQGWLFLTRLKSNRLVNPDGTGNRPIKEIHIPQGGIVVHLRGFGFVKVFRTASQDGSEEYWATNDLNMTEDKRKELEEQAWKIEEYHRGLKQCCGVEKFQVRKTESIIGHIQLALRAFLRLELNRLITGISWYEAKLRIVREAIREFRANFLFRFL